MIKYKELWIVTLADESKVIKNQLLLKDSSYDSQTGLDVDLTGDGWFNTEFSVKEINKKISISSLNEVYDYCSQNNIDIDSKRITEKGLLVGGEVDFLIDAELNGCWVEDL